MTAERKVGEGNADHARQNIYLICTLSSSPPALPSAPWHFMGLSANVAQQAKHKNKKQAGGGAPCGGGPAAAVAIVAAGGGGLQVSIDQCNASLLCDAQACIKNNFDHDAFCGHERGSTNRIGVPRRSAPTRIHMLAQSTSGHWTLPS